MLPFDDQSINEEQLPLELNPNLVPPNLSYFPSTANPSTFYASSSSFDNHDLFGLANASVPVTAAAAAISASASASADTRKGTRKGRHSKICTAKGPRDRRMRLSIDVARNFFRLQDMLGFDKASNTVQWLLTMSKAAIKELASVSSSKISTLLGNPSLESTESTTLRCDDQAAASSGSKKAAAAAAAAKATKAKKESAAKPSKKITELHSAQAKELRAKARERARERTREKQRMMSSSSSSFPIALDPMSDHDSSFQLKTLLEFANRQVEGDICAAALPTDTIPVLSNSQAAMAEMNMASYMFEEQWEMEALSMYSR